ncbi:PD-(D/E)XK nuclease family protein [Sulfuracidifex tepidarius]|nr:PD-(D/E)XK nuclease family protein [Sulfuracidifex tepidarius]
MSLADEIKKILTENPSIIADVLTSRPEILYQALAKLMPWQNLATKDDLKDLATKEELEEIKRVMATKDDIKNIATKDDIKNIATKDDIKNIATKDDIKNIATKDDIKNIATKKDIKRLEVTISALGARWGITAEDVFRQGIVELLADVGWKVDREITFDKEGFVYGYPSEVEIDVVVNDGKVILVELNASLKRGELVQISKKREFYEKVKGRKVSEVMVVTPFIDDRNEERVVAIANSLGIKIVKPSELDSQD